MALPATTSQTVGPFFKIGLARLYCTDLASPQVPGERVTIAGRVLDGDGQGVPDAILEVWQANAAGKYAHPEDPQQKPIEPQFTGFGRVPTGDDGSFRFTTIKPGSVPGPGGTRQAPHLVVGVFMRGLLRRLITRIYFENDPANADDFALARVELSRRATLMAKRSPTGETMEWNVILQGRDETVFFDC